MPRIIYQYCITLLLAMGLFLTGPTHSANNDPQLHEACTVCHVDAKPTEKSAALVRPLDTLCTECHAAKEGFTQHAIGVAPLGGDAGGLPLVEGKIACITCHDSHVTTKGLLRINSEELCRACHNK